ncbi:LytTR family DNA-binding domain-containing protein [Asticcacaulis sp. DXS10W]|uniref:LytTR family DNA-binding domain-containing protein n=1 Tax=Asticcacaulis currens TaxID=2984210 RepID=A0ABT5IDJ1_9CAUL|nr:LytTR family DNA-binding domain-containing protein [Asticcacaulis currens]MDC7694262.1 LytTR family DNA-binding domain-containing protein [Asticcacaulis currens]
MLDVVIVDDEPMAVRRLEILLKAFDDVRVVGTATSSIAALDLLTRVRPNLILLDIEMPGMDGVALGQKLKAEGKADYIIFATAFAQFAVDAFKLDATDYLLKPIEPERLRAGIDRVKASMATRAKSARTEVLERIVSEIQSTIPQGKSRSIWVTDSRGRLRLDISDIIWLGADGDYVRIHLSERSLFVRGKISAFGDDLRPYGFIQVHRSVMVQRSYVSKIEFIGDRRFRLTLINGTQISTSRGFAEAIRGLSSIHVAGSLESSGDAHLPSG